MRDETRPRTSFSATGSGPPPTVATLVVDERRASLYDALRFDEPGLGCGPGDYGRGRDGLRANAVAVQMELVRIVITDHNEQQIIYLREVDGHRTFPIVIGIFEAGSIDRRVRGINATRPLTHDLLANTIESLGGEVQDIFITELREHTYFAKLRIRHEGELVEVDCRPSDAIAIAVTVEVPIYVSEDVIEEASQ